jgi:hypothetical protein
VNLNIVRGVQPAGQIWVINGLSATVKSSDGSIQVTGTGLVLAGGNNAGRGLAGQQPGVNKVSVIATLICDLPTTAIPVPPQFSTDSKGVPMSATGDFTIPAGTPLSPTPPSTCNSPMLLIRNAANLGWFAVGIFKP